MRHRVGQIALVIPAALALLLPADAGAVGWVTGPQLSPAGQVLSDPNASDSAPPVITGLTLTNTRFRVGRTRTATTASKRGDPCSTVVTLGPLIRLNRGPGQVSIPFSGRVGRKTLPPGRCVGVVQAIDAAGNASAIEIVHFTVVAR